MVVQFCSTVVLRDQSMNLLVKFHYGIIRPFLMGPRKSKNEKRKVRECSRPIGGRIFFREIFRIVGFSEKSKLFREPTKKYMVTVLLVVPSRSPHLVPVTCSKWGLQQNGMQPKPVPTVLHPRIVHAFQLT